MIQDYFSLDRKGSDYYLLRIINKVDFAEEVVWACDFNIRKKVVFRIIADKILDYLCGGFDALEKWDGDREGFHESIQHFGFDNVIKTYSLVPDFITGHNHDPFLKVFFERIKLRQNELSRLELPTKAGLLYDALVSLNIPAAKPKDADADVCVPLAPVFAGEPEKISSLLDNFS